MYMKKIFRFGYACLHNFKFAEHGAINYSCHCSCNFPIETDIADVAQRY